MILQPTNTPADLATDACDSLDVETSFNNTLKVLGDFWVLRILGALDSNPQRFCELERTLKNSNPVTLTKRLKSLEDNGFIYRRHDDDKQPACYALTEKGIDTLPVIAAVKRFSLDHQ